MIKFNPTAYIIIKDTDNPKIYYGCDIDGNLCLRATPQKLTYTQYLNIRRMITTPEFASNIKQTKVNYEILTAPYVLYKYNKFNTKQHVIINKDKIIVTDTPTGNTEEEYKKLQSVYQSDIISKAGLMPNDYRNKLFVETLQYTL